MGPLFENTTPPKLVLLVYLSAHVAWMARAQTGDLEEDVVRCRNCERMGGEHQYCVL